MKLQTKIIVMILLLLSAIAGFVVSMVVHQTNPAPVTPERLRTYHYPISFVEQVKNDPQAGEKIFHAYCATCHGKHPQIPLNAPLIGDSKRWAGIKTMGMKMLLRVTRSGVGAMPARGGCFECEDKQLKQAIAYILKHS